MTRARNLANLGNKNAITADIGLFNIGIGSTQPHDYKLEVVGGDAYIGGGVTITGNLSVGGTVTYEDVTNVDAVGIITANKGVNIVGGGLTCVGVATFFSASIFKDDVTFTGAAANVTWDKSTDDLIFNDNAKAIFGTSSDGLEIYHDSSHSYIADTGTGRLHINSSQLRVNNAADNEILIDATQDTGVSLYDGANTVRLATNGNGVIVTGIATVSGDANVNGTPPWSADSSNAGVLSISGNNASTNGNIRLGNGAAATNADFDLGRIQTFNGATEVARITGGTGDSNNDTGLLQFFTKSNGETLAERVKIKANGEIELGKSTYTSPVNVLFNANRSTADDSLGSISGVWNGDSVASIAFKAGADTTNKDDGRITFNTRPSGSGMAERMRVTEDGQVGINTTNPGGRFGIAVDNSSTNVLATGGNIINLKNTNTTDNSWVSMDFNNSAGGIVGRFGAQFADTSDKSTDLYFATRKDGGALTEAFRIDRSQLLLAGTTSSRNIAGGYAKLQIESASSEGMSIIRTSDDSGGVYLSLGKTRDGSVCQAGDKLGYISWQADDGTDLNHPSAEIYTEVASGISGNDVPGDLVFSINGGTTTTTERMRIDSTGAITVGNRSDIHSSAALARFGIDCQGRDIFDNVAESANYGLCFYNDPTTNKANGIGFFNDDGSTAGGYIVHQDKGSGNLGDILFGTSETSDTPTEKMRITHDGKILVAHTSSHADMHGKIQVCSNTSHGIDIARYTANPHPPYLNLFKSRNGTVGSNTATLASDNCGTITGYGNDGSGFHAVGSLNFECDEDSANDDMPGRFAINITADGGTTLTERFRIDKNGTTWFQKAQVDTQFDTQAFIRCHPTSTINSGGRSIILLGTSTAANYGTAMCGYRRGTSGEPTWELRMLNDSITGTQVEEVRNSGYHAILSTESLLNMNTSQDGSGSDYFARGSKNSTTAGGGNDVFWIYEDGDMYNVNGTFSQSSDSKLKENIVDAPSQWNDLKALKVRKFNFKASTGLDTHTQIGMVAQEVESTCPGLIKERVDLQKTTNSDGTVTETDTGEKTKSIKLTVLYMKAVKALQEAMTRIETLETENTDLKTLIKNSSSFAALKASL